MLRLDIRELRRGPVSVSAELPIGCPELEGLALELAGPVRVEGVLQGSPERRTCSWEGRISTKVGAECRRCLVALDLPILAEVKVVFSPDPDAADDPGVYPLGAPGTEVDLAPAVREELLLAVPAFVLCREECAGLCQRCGADLNSGPCACASAAEPV